MPSMEPTRISGPERAIDADWRARYAPHLRERVVHRQVAAPKLTLVVISYRAKEYLIECLQHLRGQTAAGEVSFEILLADSGGIDHLRPRTSSLCDVELRLTDGIPLNAARNAAAAWARGEYIAFIDDDGLVAPTFVEVVCNLFADPRVGAVRGRIVAKQHPYFCTLGGHYDRGDEVVDDVLATEGHMAIRRALYLAAGGFPDEAYGAEGVYLAYRIAKIAPTQRVIYAPDLLMRHDYCDSWSHFVWKVRRYRESRDEVSRLVGDPDFVSYLEAYRARTKPQRPLTAELRAARSLLKAARWVILHASRFADASRAPVPPGTPHTPRRVRPVPDRAAAGARPLGSR